ncbi:patatin-like phospholipase family protein [Myxococcota bacterium]|nr:patatin-like phospholipase family protein [Myxococcota bacterium]
MRVLSLDGMSAAALQIRLIRAFEQANPGFIRSVDCFVGASDGGYMALFLASRVTDDDAANLAMLDEAIAFNNALVPLFHLSLRKGVKFATGWYPLLCVDQFRQVFQRYLGDGNLGQVRRKLVVCSFGAISWSPVIYSNLEPDVAPGPRHRGTPDTSLVDLALATSALPLALPMYGKGAARVIDGGWVATNPTMLGVSELCRAQARLRAVDPTAVLASLRVLSLGARDSLAERKSVLNRPPFGMGYLFSRNSWGWMQWIVLRPWLLLDMSLQGTISLAHQELLSILPEARYRRIHPPMSEIQDGWRLLLGCPDRLIRSFDQQAAGLVGDPRWFEANNRWIRDHYLAPEAAAATR